MSFSPAQLNEAALDQLSVAFSQSASRITGSSHTPQQSRTILLDIMGHRTEPSSREVVTEALELRATRKLLWQLLSTQMQAGIAMNEALSNIKQGRQKLGFPEVFDAVLDTWMTMNKQGHPPQEFMVTHVLPIDFEEGLRLSFHSRLSSFGDALAIEAGRR